MFLEGVEIPIVVEQSMPARQAKCRDQVSLPLNFPAQPANTGLCSRLDQ